VLETVQRVKRPVYIELPRDQVHIRPRYEHASPTHPQKSEPLELREAVEEARRRLAQSKRPVLLVGVEAHRFNLQDKVVELAEKNHIPMCSTLLGKSVVSESHPLYVGVYEGAMGRETPRKFVEDSDCVLMIGTFMTDINLGVYTANLDPSKCIRVTSEDLTISYHHFRNVLFADFVTELTKKPLGCGKREMPSRPSTRAKPYTPNPGAPCTIARVYEKINTILGEDMVVICDVGDALFAGADLRMSRRTEFLSPAYYTSMGFAIPATLGALRADPKSRPIVMVGDGAFQMTGTELSTIHRLGLAPIIVVLNNKGYTTERFIKDGGYNDIGNWNYHKITELIGGGWGFEVRTETDLEKAMDAALANTDSFSLLNIHLDPYDRSEAMERLARRLAEKLGPAEPS
jgi:indolepyruvate decarboxylase